MKNNIILVGLMGAGKTTVGKLLAKHLHRPFIDSDHEIERRTGVNIPLIFEIEGEPGFRARETAVLEELVTRDGIVLATGGGAVLSAYNRQLLGTNGTVVYLRAKVEELWQRTRHDKNRPLLQTDDPQARLRELFAERDPLYREVAHIVMDTGRHNLHALVRQLERQLARPPEGDADSRPSELE